MAWSHAPNGYGYKKSWTYLPIVKICQKKSQCSSQLPVYVRHLTKNLRANHHIAGIIHTWNPEPQDISSIGRCFLSRQNRNPNEHVTTEKTNRNMFNLWLTPGLFPPPITVAGSTTFPKDLLIFKPLSSSTNPCVITPEYGAFPEKWSNVSTEKHVAAYYFNNRITTASSMKDKYTPYWIIFLKTK